MNEKELIEKVVAIVKLAELKKAIREQKAKVAALEEKYKNLYAELYDCGYRDPEYMSLNRKVNGMRLGLYSADKKLERLLKAFYELEAANPEDEDLFYL